MIELTPEQIKEYFHRSYTAVDGLWFMKVEEKFGFEAALDIDDEVWKVFAMIQARMLKSMSGMSGGMDALLECLTTKLDMEGFKFAAEQSGEHSRFTMDIVDCPWHNLMIKSQRENLSGAVGNLICNTEYAVWAAEFGDKIAFRLGERICGGAARCLLHFEVV